MKNFNREDRTSGGKRFDRDRGFRREDRSDRPTMHQATCAQCGKECHVPFKPTGDKPVFCSDCFGKKESFGDNRSQRRDSARPSFGDKKMFKVICDKCRRECEVPFKPTGDKPVFCSDCFSKSEKKSGGSNFSNHFESNFKGNDSNHDQVAEQLETLNNKLDNILRILSAKSSFEKTVETGTLTVSAPKIIDKKVITLKPASSKKIIKKVVKKELKKVVVKKKNNSR